jgi:hypothetical protein
MKAIEWRRMALCVFLGVGLSGCNKAPLDTVFYTVSNMGVNFDTRPPTAEIALSRREGVIQPEFEGGVHLPVIATSNSSPGIFAGRVAATFIGGAAAEIAARESKVTDETKLLERGPGIVCVTKLPDGTDGRLALPGPGATRPFIFGTSTNYGLFVGWDSVGAGIPDTVRIGYTRKELAIASVFAAGDCPAAIKSHFQTGATEAVAMPSFLATINGGHSATTPQGTELSVRQSFATGSAARLLANDAALRTALRQSISAEARQNAAEADNAAQAARKAAADQKLAADKAVADANAAASGNAPVGPNTGPRR